jgi:hypothetical protein
MTPASDEVYVKVTDHAPWEQGDVLSLKSFPSTSILRYGRKGEHLCRCKPEERHRSLFTVNLQFVSQNLLGRIESPNIDVCFNAENIWECRLPREITGLTNRVEFKDLPNVRTALKVLKKGTFWFPQLLHRRKLKESSFGRQMARLLAGMTSAEGKEPLGLIKSMRISGPAVQRLRSMLAVADGLLMQAAIAFPGAPEVQNWTRMDQIQRSLIANILPDYFRDLDPNRVTTFEKVKDLRKKIKKEVFNPIGTVQSIYVPRELSAMKVLMSLIRGKTPLSYLQGMLMSQTRASGVPPRILYDRTLAKTKEILTTPSDIQGWRNLAQPIASAVDHLYGDLLVRLGGQDERDKFFGTVMHESKISLSDSGEFFTPTEMGGKLEAARVVLQQNPEIPEVNLHTGELTGVILDQNSPTGERLFHWACGKFRNRSECYNNNSMSCRISLVAELGKYRTITVSVLQHALLLHPMSHMGLKILEAFPSSESGIGAANHAWNFFKRLSHKNPSAAFVFREDVESVVYSTDWKNATDYCDPYIATAMLSRLLDLLGIPQWYRQTIVFALCAPRQVETLDRNGCPIDCFFTERGVLMGDPVTKVVLHLYHLVGRRIGEDLMYRIFVEGVLDESDEESEDEDA